MKINHRKRGVYMRYRVLINEHTNQMETVLGSAKISRGGTIYLPKKTEDAIRHHSELAAENILDIDKTVYQGPNHTVRISSCDTFKAYEDELREEIDTTTPDGRKLFRLLTCKNHDVKGDVDKIKIQKVMSCYMGLDFEESENRKKNIIIGYEERGDEDKSQVYFIMYPLYNYSKKLILLSASLMSETGRILASDAINLLKLPIDDEKKVVIIYGSSSEISYSKDASKEEKHSIYENAFAEGFKSLGFTDKNILFSSDFEDNSKLSETIESADYIYIPDGNIYQTLKNIKARGIADSIRKSVLDNKAVYIGSSAGAVAAGVDIDLIDYGEFDKNEVKLPADEFVGLGLFKGTLIPHYDEDEYLERFKKSMITDDKLDLLERYSSLFRIGEEEVVIIV